MHLAFLAVWAVLSIYSKEAIASDSPAPRVTTAQGDLEGRIVTSAQGAEVEEYLGIPFAQPPIGNLRYADPLPAKPWTGVKSARDYGDSCHQILDTAFGNFTGSAMWNAPNAQSEDCLFLNVWAPHPRPNDAAVLVWIFGGGFYSGTAALSLYNGKTLADFSDIVVVSMNYRVGSLGFLATGDGRIKGNFGLKDQQLALAWIGENIEQFGGDPNSVTIMGESAGAASVGYHMMSDGSKGLFHRGIMQSGSPDVHWAYMSPEVAKERSTKLFTALKCANDDKVLECLRDPKLTPTTIVSNEWVDARFLVFPWAPTIDGSFITDSPSNLIKKGRVNKHPLLLGTNKNEGTFWIVYAVPTFSKDTASPQTWGEMLKAVDITEYDLSDDLKSVMVTLYMLGLGKDNTSANRDAIDKMVADRSFICPTIEFARSNVLSDEETFFYRLQYRASNEVWPPWMGVIHGAEIQYVFGVPLNASLGYSQDDVTVAKEIMTYWSNFAKYGTPNDNRPGGALKHWPDFSQHEKYIDFLPGAKTGFGRDLRAVYCDFWSVVRAIHAGKA